ncbi:MAG: urate hydroxylase PuuD [Methylococcales bacterium]|nr:urate hydroxylase PuuD [Methylococcales bacterium]
MEIITTSIGIEMLLRWGHFLAGITWIGMLYYFNFVQTEFFKEADAGAKADALQKLVPRALWWFRWGAMFTFLTGVGIMGLRGAGMPIDIWVGALLGTFMFLNVWLIIWPNQQIVIASAKQVAAGGEAIAEAATSLATAGLASRTNTLFSIPMLFFMGASSHYAHPASSMIADLTAIIVVLLIQYNAARSSLDRFDVVKKLPAAGKMGPMASVTGVIHCGLGLTVVLYMIIDLL